jgi:hypothetical protein
MIFVRANFGSTPMDEKQLTYRVGGGKGLGLLFGLIGFFALPYFVEEPSIFLRIGILLWYPTVGAFVGLAGVFAHHPILNMSLPWFVRGPLIGGWMNVLIVMFAHDQLIQMTDAWNIAYGIYVSPYWLILEGVLIGSVMDWLLTRWFGEGLD